jgi:hypothetical protein
MATYASAVKLYDRGKGSKVIVISEEHSLRELFLDQIFLLQEALETGWYHTSSCTPGSPLVGGSVRAISVVVVCEPTEELVLQSASLKSATMSPSAQVVMAHCISYVESWRGGKDLQNLATRDHCHGDVFEGSHASEFPSKSLVSPPSP